MEQRFIASANRAMRIIVAYEQRESDEFEIRALSMAMARHPKYTDEDYEAGIVDYHSRPQQRRMKAGDVIAGARAWFDKRTDARAIESSAPDDAVPRPANYKNLVAQFTQINREFAAQGIIATNEDLLKEHSRRVQEARR